MSLNASFQLRSTADVQLGTLIWEGLKSIGNSISERCKSIWAKCSSCLARNQAYIEPSPSAQRGIDIMGDALDRQERRISMQLPVDVRSTSTLADIADQHSLTQKLLDSQSEQ